LKQSTLRYKHDGRIESASSGGGGRYDYRYFIDHNFAEVYAQEAIRQALVALEAQDAPAGKLPVILGPGWPGVLLHEAIGHGLEGDFNRKGTSVFTGKIGEQVASEKCTIVDNGTLANRRGSLTVDDEGTQTQNTTLIENGILKGYMFDKMNAKLMGVEPTGNGRRESYAHIPMPRMTNTLCPSLPQTPTPLSSFRSLATMEIFFSASSPEPMRVAPLTGWLILPFLIR
jgi:TldD protein